MENNVENENNEFKPLPFWKEIFLKKEALADYYRSKREYEYNHGIELNLGWREKIHPILLNLLSLNRKYIDKQKLTVIKDERENTEKPVIYAITHIGKFDYQLVSEAIRSHQIPFAGDPETMYRTFDGFFLGINGIIYCDTESKTDRKIGKETAINLLENGKNLLIYPEGVWNVTTNLLVIPLFPGVIEMSQTTGCDIVPVAIEQYGKDFVVNIGKNFKVSSMEENKNKQYINEKRTELRDAMATLKWEIMEARETIKREDLGTYEEEKEKFVETRLNEWFDKENNRPFYSEDVIASRTYKEKNVEFQDAVFSYLKDLKINKNNAFCFRKDISLPTDIQQYIKNKLQEELNTDNYFNDEEEINKSI